MSYWRWNGNADFFGLLEQVFGRQRGKIAFDAQNVFDHGWPRKVLNDEIDDV